MHFAVKKSAAWAATASLVGLSSLFAATPAYAGALPPAPASCTHGGTPILGNICELKLVSSVTFAPSAHVSQLEALLVGGGGSGSAAVQNYDGGGGGGGDVRVVGFGSDTTTPLVVSVGGPGQASEVTQGATTERANSGTDAVTNGGGTTAGRSGNGRFGSLGGGGAGGDADGGWRINGGVGKNVADAGPAPSLFSNDTASCFGGGGGAGTFTTSHGIPGCGGGTTKDGATDLAIVPPVPNSGGGGAAGSATSLAADRAGAGGLVVLRWVPLQDVTVSFVSGHGAPVAPQTFAEGGAATRPTDPTEAGFAFNGWFVDAAFTTPVDFTAPVTVSTNFYASWSPVAPATVTVSFDSNGHGTSIAPQTVPVGGAASKPADPTATGFVFNGWFSDAALKTPADFSAPVTASTVFYASWSPVAPATVTVSFDSNGHGTSIAPQTVPVGGTASKPTDPTATGFVFNGWFSDAALKTPADFSAPVTASTVFYASWSPIAPTTVTVTFVNEHGVTVTQEIPVGGTLAKPADPTMAGFVFNGWFSDAALTVPADFSAPVTTSMALYASWSAVPKPVDPTPAVPAAPAVSDTGLASTGADIGPAAVPLGLAALGLGLGLVAFGARRARKSN